VGSQRHVEHIYRIKKCITNIGRKREGKVWQDNVKMDSAEIINEGMESV
jgi:hypothetical protein